MKRTLITVLAMIMTVITFGQYQPINNGESGLSVRTKLNAMHAELYDYNLAAEYSANGISGFHTTKLTTDKYVRFSSDQGSVWTSPAMYYFDGINIINSLNLNSNRVTGMASGVDPTDAVNVQQLVDSIAAATGISGSNPAWVHSDTTATIATQFYVDNYIETLDVSKNTYSIEMPNAASVQGRIDGTTLDPEIASWVLTAAANNIDLIVTHNLGRRVHNVNVMTVNGTIEQLLRPFAGAYSGWQTNNENQLQINGLATTPLPIKIYISFE